MKYYIAILLSGIVLILGACKSPSSTEGGAPADHTVNRGGYRHKTGLNDPLNNRTPCHGSDLRGGTSGVSCYKCHGQKW